MHISSPEVYPTQFTQQLPSELVKSARIAAIDSIVVCDFKSFSKTCVIQRDNITLGHFST